MCAHVHAHTLFSVCSRALCQHNRDYYTSSPPHTATSHLYLFSSTPAARMKSASLSMRSAPFMLLCSLLSKNSCCASYDSVAFGSSLKYHPSCARCCRARLSWHEFMSWVTLQLDFYSDQFVKWPQPCKVRHLNYIHVCLQRLSCACSSLSISSCFTYTFGLLFQAFPKAIISRDSNAINKKILLFLLLFHKKRIPYVLRFSTGWIIGYLLANSTSVQSNSIKLLVG